MKNNKRITLLAAMLLLTLYGRSQHVIDMKGTMHALDSSKWVLSGADLYNKNTGTVGIGTNGVANSNAALEVKATDKGFLVPRVALTGLTAAAPLGAHVAGMMVYNTATAGTAPNNVMPGFYYNDGTKWIQVADATMQDLRLVSGNNHITQDAGTGSNGTAVGTGTDNIAIGQNTLSGNTTGSRNIAVGFNAGSQNTTGVGNVAVGYNALTNNTAGQNTALGYHALSSNTTGSNNLALGAQTLRANETGTYNIAIGNEALYRTTQGSRNIGIGYTALKENTAYENIGIGYAALSQNTSGTFSTALGVDALKNNTTGSSNTALGYHTLTANTTGGNNAAVGNLSLNKLTDGSDNTALGAASGLNLTSGSDNTLLGFRSGQDLTSGRGNTALGFRSAEGITTGSYNTILGANLIGLPSGLTKNIIIADGQGNRRINVDSLGNVGLSTTAQKSRLDVPGYIKLGSTDATADALSTAANRAGMIRYNATNKIFEYHDDTQWRGLSTSGAVDTTNDAWVNDNANSIIKLGTLSDGITARPAGTEFVAKDDGKVGIGTANPVWELDVQGPSAIGHFKRFTGSLANNVAPTVLLTRSRGTLAAETDITAGDYLGKVQFRGRVGGTDPDYGLLAYIANSTAPGDGRFAFLKGSGGAGNEVFSVNTNSGNVGIGITAPTAKLDIRPASASESALRIENISNSKDKQDANIIYTTPNSPMYIDGNGFVYKKYNPVTTDASATTFDGSYTLTGANNPVTMVSLNNGSIVRFQLYIYGLLLGASGTGANLYADITYGYGGGGFRVATYASETGGTATNIVNAVTSNNGHTLTFDFASGADFVITNSGGTDAGPLTMYYTAGSSTTSLVVDIFQSFRSR